MPFDKTVLSFSPAGGAKNIFFRQQWLSLPKITPKGNCGYQKDSIKCYFLLRIIALKRQKLLYEDRAMEVFNTKIY